MGPRWFREPGPDRAAIAWYVPPPMERWKTLDVVATPDGRELSLTRRGDMFLIAVDGEELMSSRTRGSEEALARLALEALGHRSAPRVLVGGLGMGFTLRALLDELAERPGASGAEVVVAEVFPAVVEWNRGPLAELADRPVDDPRVRVEVGDVAERLRADEPYDVVLLDVDNGPDAFTLERNRFLYSRAGIERIAAAVVDGGVLAVWSDFDDPRFVDRLRRGGFDVRTHRVAARRGGRGGRHVIFVGRKPLNGRYATRRSSRASCPPPTAEPPTP